jgi:16S rRNA (guanine527-N7)-methyltransferase
MVMLAMLAFDSNTRLLVTNVRSKNGVAACEPFFTGYARLSCYHKNAVRTFLLFPGGPFAILSHMNEHLLKLLEESALAVNVSLDQRALALLDGYYRELLMWNEKMNLVSFRTPEELIIKHFVDSLTPLPYLAHPQGRLLDIGSGGGFPGIPLQIACPGLHVSLLEASRKKSSFLKHLLRRLPLEQAGVIHARVESVMNGRTYCRQFDTVVSRAAFKLSLLQKMGLFFLAPGGLLIAMKGPRSEADEDENPGLILRRIACHDVCLPRREGQRKIIIYQADK